jgi:hypothetical protein
MKLVNENTSKTAYRCEMHEPIDYSFRELMALDGLFFKFKNISF